MIEPMTEILAGIQSHEKAYRDDMRTTVAPDPRVLAECDGLDDCAFVPPLRYVRTPVGAFGEAVGVPVAETQDGRHEAIQEARRSIHRAITSARVARDALTLFIADGDRALDELNGGGW